MRCLIALFCLCFAVCSQAAFTVTVERRPVDSIASAPQPSKRLGVDPIDKVLVLKTSRQLQLISGGEPLKIGRASCRERV